MTSSAANKIEPYVACNIYGVPISEITGGAVVQLDHDHAGKDNPTLALIIPGTIFTKKDLILRSNFSKSRMAKINTRKVLAMLKSDHGWVTVITRAGAIRAIESVEVSLIGYLDNPVIGIDVPAKSEAELG